LFEFERVKLKFTTGALAAVAREAMKRKSGARGLRAILENVMLEIMYDIPSRTNIREVVISEDVIVKKQEPVFVYEKKAESA
ncbi:MAG: ATP-dependent Clp protease ATP-binding subunit ClpX, partial [Deltaproteobacteria bacterium]|nr:ATP-dependent Clp protease ATP-binding subunit ClpX [Deltaproteobacteria bacterium]